MWTQLSSQEGRENGTGGVKAGRWPTPRPAHPLLHGTPTLESYLGCSLEEAGQGRSWQGSLLRPVTRGRPSPPAAAQAGLASLRALPRLWGLTKYSGPTSSWQATLCCRAADRVVTALCSEATQGMDQGRSEASPP